MTTLATPYLNTTFVASVSPLSSALEKRHPSHGASEPPGFESDEVIRYTYSIYMVCVVCALPGIVVNFINIFVIAKMKFKETINIALMALAISDLCSLLSLLWYACFLSPLVVYSGLPILTLEIQSKLGAWTHIISTRLTGFITMYITLERCLCVVFPLKVKTMLTPKRTLGAMVSVYVLVVGTLSPYFGSIFRILSEEVLKRNNTMVPGMIHTDNVPLMRRLVYYFNIVYVMMTFTGVVVCTSVLIWKLRQRAKFVSSATSGQSTARNGLQNVQIIKMVICVALVFIISFLPSIVFLAVFMIAGLDNGQRYQSLYAILLAVGVTFGAFNSSANIFIYYKMSSKFAVAFRSVFCCREER